MPENDSEAIDLINKLSGTYEYYWKECEPSCSQWQLQHFTSWKAKSNDRDTKVEGYFRKLGYDAEHELKTELNLDILASSGFIYFIQCGSFVKIGIAENVHSRLRALKIAAPEPIKIINFFEDKNAGSVEKNFHRLLKKYHSNGEWFKLDNDIINFIKTSHSVHTLFETISALLK